MKSPITLCLAWLLVLSSTSSGAVVVNGGFEDASDFSGWSRAGLTSIETNYFTIAPPGGTKQALLQTGDGAEGNTGASIAELATLLNIAPADITAVAPNAFNGSAIRQTLTVNALDTLTFDWNFLTSEGVGTPQDTAFFSVSRVGGTSQTFLLARPINANIAFTEAGFKEQTGYKSLTPPFQFNLAGDYVVGFGVVNLDDARFPSGLLVDKVTLTAVPEPTALAGLGLLGLSLAMRRRRRK